MIFSYCPKLLKIVQNRIKELRGIGVAHFWASVGMVRVELQADKNDQITCSHLRFVATY